MHRQTKATSIPQATKDEVNRRDGGHCIICGAPGDPCAHVVRRSQGGMGIVQNIVTLCNECHYSLDEGLFLSRLKPLGLNSQAEVREYVIGYLKGFYPDWTEEAMKYKKWED